MHGTGYKSGHPSVICSSSAMGMRLVPVPSNQSEVAYDELNLCPDELRFGQPIRPTSSDASVPWDHSSVMV